MPSSRHAARYPCHVCHWPVPGMLMVLLRFSYRFNLAIGVIVD